MMMNNAYDVEVFEKLNNGNIHQFVHTVYTPSFAEAESQSIAEYPECTILTIFRVSREELLRAL